MRQPQVVELFSGAGGFSLGFQAAGCRIAAAVDIDEDAGRTFETNFSVLQPGDPPLLFHGPAKGNLEDMDLDQITCRVNPDILIGGPPCQGFSKLGRGKLDSLSEEGFRGDPRNELYRRFLDAAGLWRPKAVIMENVPGMLSVGGANVAAEAARELSALGYRVGYAVLNAVWYGVPQYRERLFFIGIRDDLDSLPAMPAATHHAILPSGYLRPSSQLFFPFVRHGECPVDLATVSTPATTVAEALDDLPPLFDHLAPERGRPAADFSKALTYRSVPQSNYVRLMRQWPSLGPVDAINDHVIRRTPRDYETFGRMKHGDRYPEALAIARERFHEALEELRASRMAPEVASREYQELQRKFVPPYREDIFMEKWQKLSPSLPSWTVPAHLSKDAYSHIHHDSEQKRAISPREAARLQSFPDAFKFMGNMGDCYRQIGNAVPPLLAWAIACSVLEILGVNRTGIPFLSAGRSDSVEVGQSVAVL